ncbi:DNA-processing protein DprA, partial [Candidatus Gracilibacteria bacterium]|nr:DNA-processing protein DprA [Candidatus Gracilibacteria bacterium]
PKSLREIPHSPYILYVRGILPQGEMFAVVGSRTMTCYGQSVIQKIIPDIAKIFTIVSGGALGCDSEAHKTTLACGGNTLSVIGTGIDKDYPAKHAKLFPEIVQKGGAIISIFPIGEEAMPYNFPIRNEIVVGLSKGVLVVEAKEKSGTLITAGLCLDMGRDLFAVPGDILKNSHTGVNMLIKNGEAKCVLVSGDILEEYDILLKKSFHSAQLPLLTDAEQMIYSELCNDELSIDNLAMRLRKTSSELSIILSMLELKGLIRRQLSGKFRLN